MDKFVMVKVDIPIERDSVLHRKLEIIAEKLERPIEDVITTMVQMGVYGHIEGNLSVYERLSRSKQPPSCMAVSAGSTPARMEQAGG